MRENKSSKWLRLFDLIHRIAAEPGRSSKELAVAMGRSSRTIFRDVKELDDLGFPIYNDNGYRFAADAFMPSINLQPAELFSLFLGTRLLEGQEAGELALHARRALEKLTRATPEGRREDIGQLREQVQIAEPSEDTGIARLIQLQAVVGDGRQIRISYLGLHDEQAKARIVDPMGLFGFRQAWYLRAYDHLRSDFRSFRLSRIVEWEQLDSLVEHPAKMELHEAVYHRWDLEGGVNVAIELRVSESLSRWLHENPPHPSQKLAGGSAFYSVSDLTAVARWVAGLHGLEVVGPEELRLEMARLGDELRNRYSGGVATS